MLQKNTTFEWIPVVHAAFQMLKSLLVKAMKNSPKYFNRNLPITVQDDASFEGLGLALLHCIQPSDAE